MMVSFGKPVNQQCLFKNLVTIHWLFFIKIILFWFIKKIKINLIKSHNPTLMLGLKTLLLMLKNKIKIRYFPPIAGFFFINKGRKWIHTWSRRVNLFFTSNVLLLNWSMWNDRGIYLWWAKKLIWTTCHLWNFIHFNKFQTSLISE